ncbi:MAG: hypothetical protein Q7S33_02460 [Nanoarchaeota archaeon]|nr:hypothetical protein [Nanoarchaeota archaeon]
MEFIGAYWWLWLIFSVICTGYAIFNQVKRMKNFHQVMLSRMNPVAASNSFFSGLIPLIISGLLATGFSILLGISIVVNIIQMIK